MRSLLVLALVPLFVSAVARHTPGAGCFDDDMPATGVVQFSMDDEQFYLVDDADGDAAGLHVYEETNGVNDPQDPAHTLTREASHAGHAHPDLKPGCEDPDVLPDLHHF